MRASAPFLLPLASLVALSACDPKPTVIDPNKEADEAQAKLEKAHPVTLPPAIAASRTYRCADNALVFIDWFEDGSASVRVGKDGAAERLPAPAAGSPLSASGFVVKGSRTDDEITATAPGHKSQKCHV